MGIIAQVWQDMIEYGMKPNSEIVIETSQSVTISGQRLFYRVVSVPNASGAVVPSATGIRNTGCSATGAGSSLVLLHGYGVSGAIWQRVLPLLAQHYRVIVVDLPGYGRSQFTGTWRLREIAPLLAGWLQQMGLPPAVLIGHSMGGAIAIHLTASAPELVDRLILVNAAGLPLRAQFPTLAARSIGSFFQPGNGSLPLQVLRDHLCTSRRLLWQSAQEIARSDFRVELAMISVPTLIIWGERDLLLPLTLGHELQTALPHATFVTMPQCGHRPMLTQPAMFSQTVLRFLQQS